MSLPSVKVTFRPESVDADLGCVLPAYWAVNVSYPGGDFLASCEDSFEKALECLVDYYISRASTIHGNRVWECSEAGVNQVW